jgi:diketogulonate reductase-like aldo/keto reductase
MRYETFNGLQIPKIGFGTWKIGGGSSPDRSQDARGLAALRSALELGYAHFDTAELYAGGHCEELLGQAVRESRTPRESLFIATKVRPEHLRYEAVLKACEGSLRRLGMDYLDLYLIHWPGGGTWLPDAFRALNKLVADGKVRHIGVSNFDLRLLKAAEEQSETPLLTDQVPYSLSDRSYARNGVLAYCQSRGILLTAYTPLGQGWFRSNKAVQPIARAHSATPQQIALAWLVAQRCVITIPMSADPAHQKQNLDALDIQLTDEEMARLT